MNIAGGLLLSQLPYEPYSYYAIGAVVGLVVLFLLFRMMSGKGSKQKTGAKGTPLKVAQLPNDGPPSGGPRLLFHNEPVRLAAIALAPVGKGADAPTVERVPQLVDAIVPGLLDVYKAHKPVVRRWPPPLSIEGFANQFFSELEMPGERGKGSPWCAAAGRFELGGQKYMAGLVLRAEKPNALAATVVKDPGQWREIFRTR